jgi:sphingosine kinase
MQRSDWLELREKITIGGIPGGTGNGLVKALLHNQNENCGIHEAAYLIIRGRRSNMDLTELKLQYYPRPIYSFLSVCWAVIADCDLNSEVLRCLGPIRFTMWGVWRCMALIRYQGSLTCNGALVRNRNVNRYADGDTEADQVVKSDEILLLTGER